MASDPQETQALAREAFVYAYPLLFNYKTLYQQTQRPDFAGYVGGFNRFRHYARPSSPDDTDIVTPNNDTPYSWCWLDLRREPIALSVPDVEDDRYYVLPAHDLYTHYLPMVGTRARGNRGGTYLFVGPTWEGEVPAGVVEIRAASWIVGCLGRTSLAGLDDVGGLRAVQRQYRLLPLSELAASKPPPPGAPIAFPVWDEEHALGPGFVSYLNFVLSLVEPHPSEADLLARFERIGIGPGRAFDPTSLDPSTHASMRAGVEEGLGDVRSALVSARGSRGLFGDRAHHGTNFVRRAAGVMVGIYGLPDEEAIYEAVGLDDRGEPLHGSRSYELRFPPEAPARLFWSVTMYRLPEQWLAANPIDRYSIGDRSQGIVRDPDGSLTIRIQTDSPGPAHEANWLPSPPGSFYLVMRFYGPTPEALSGTWTVPRAVRVPA